MLIRPVRGVNRIEQTLAPHSLCPDANLGSGGDLNHAARLSDERSEPAGRLVAPRASKDPNFTTTTHTPVGRCSVPEGTPTILAPASAAMTPLEKVDVVLIRA